MPSECQLFFHFVYLHILLDDKMTMLPNQRVNKDWQAPWSKIFQPEGHLPVATRSICLIARAFWIGTALPTVADQNHFLMVSTKDMGQVWCTTTWNFLYNISWLSFFRSLINSVDQLIHLYFIKSIPSLPAQHFLSGNESEIIICYILDWQDEYKVKFPCFKVFFSVLCKFFELNIQVPMPAFGISLHLQTPGFTQISRIDQWNSRSVFAIIITYQNAITIAVFPTIFSE